MQKLLLFRFLCALSFLLYTHTVHTPLKVDSLSSDWFLALLNAYTHTGPFNKPPTTVVRSSNLILLKSLLPCSTGCGVRAMLYSPECNASRGRTGVTGTDTILTTKQTSQSFKPIHPLPLFKNIQESGHNQFD